MVAISALAAVAVALFGTSPAFAADGTAGPQVSKDVKENSEHTGGTVELSVKGTSSYSSTSTSANVIFVVDTSGSMGDKVSDGLQSRSKLEVAKDAVKAAASTILDQNKIGQDKTKVSLVSFNRYAWKKVEKTNDIDLFNGEVNKLSAGGGTNWEAGLRIAESLVSGDSNTKNYVIFVSDGAPTYRNLYDIFGSFIGVAGNGSSDEDGANFNAANTVALRLVENHVTLYKINAYGNADNMENLGGINPNNYFDANNSAALQQALSNIAEDIVNAHDYSNVVMTDNLSNAVAMATADGKPASAKVKVTDKGGNTVILKDNNNGTYSYTEGSNDNKVFNAPKVENSKVTWDLGKDYKLEDGWTYTASFDVLFTQETLDNAAKLLNGETLGSDSSLFVDKDGSVKAYTNAESGNNVTYVEEKTVDNVTTPDSGTKPIVDRPSLTVPVASNLTVIKKVSGGAANTSEKFNFVLSNVSLAGKKYVTGEDTVTFDNNGDYTFQLAHGQSKKVVGLPVGTTLYLKETGLSGNAKTSTTAKVDGEETIVEREEDNATETDRVPVKVTARPYTLTDGKLVAPTDANTVEFTNTAELVPQTGVSVDPRPMVVLLGVAVAGGVAVVAGVRKRHGREE